MHATVAPASLASADIDAPALPGSLQGTEEDGALREDGDGELVIGPQVIRLFDYYLSAGGEEPDTVIRDRVLAAIRKSLGDRRSAEQAKGLFDRYLGYRRASRALSASGELDERLSAVRRLRRDHFGALADRLFGDDERETAAALERRRVIANGTLSAEDRERQLGEIEGRLPDAIREARAAAAAPLLQREEEDAMRAAGASAEEIHAQRVAKLGEAAAERLADLDARRAAWKERLDAFRAARAAIERDEPDEGRRRAAITALLERSFAPLERIRVEAADRREAEARAR